MSMHDFTNWSLFLGRWRGVTLRLHIFFLLFAVVTIGLSVSEPGPSLLSLGALATGILLFSLILHELGHYIAAQRLQVDVDQIVIGPFGGLARPRLPAEPHELLFVALAGPLVTLGIVVTAAFALLAAGETQVSELLNPIPSLALFLHIDPLLPHAQQTPIYEIQWKLAVKLTVWLNWMLFLLNLLPAFPFDGREALRALLWPAVGRRTAAIHTARAGIVAAALLVLAAISTRNLDYTTVPHWLPIVMLSIFVFFSAKQDLTESRSSGGIEDWAEDDALSDGDDELTDAWLTADDDADAVLVEQWNEKRENREQRRRELEAQEDAQVDRILQMLHETGFDRLSTQDREVLNRASQRYRRRRRT